MKVWILLGALMMASGCSFLYEDVSESGQAEAVIDVTSAETPWEIVPFEAVNESGEEVTEETYEGEWWLAKTIFTRCPTVCMVMTPNMVSLQEEVNDRGLDLQIVSFTVDPEFDDPEQLTEYGESYGADFSNWDFLTGYEPDMIKDLALESFKAQIMELPEQSDIMHPVRFYLISPEGQIVRMYSGESNFELDSSVDDIEYMINEWP
ncbi:SCO family protein [Salisediminibacterium selenitireducens]|uniref:Electron transport protein SCO1/SenC n=1 Tax=Bacillus selenitireducens (strain ATCC 700615 / DSM 15326 / MLS10) TaxID=439292 RepID=D6XT99_BACIE|nr:SCO family protein [Salisediminibacterium selenitireducens]ADH99035.1 electron transport protein SCO1/SenC [[Bacillus] selenitireducens MLS10]